jgi:Flp pilus assembly protein TadG
MRIALSRLAREQRGAAIIELAFAAPFLAALVIGMTDLARGYSTKLQIEQAAQRTVERIEQQKSVSTTSYNSTLTAEATSAMADAGFTSGSGNQQITADSWLECSSNGTTWTRQPDFSGDCPNASDITARYISVRISRDFSPMFRSRHWPGATSSGNFRVSGFAEVRIQ